MRTLRSALLVFLFSTLVLAQFRPGALRRSHEATNVVRDYLRLELEGARLNPASWPRLKALTSWKSNPEWQGFTIVSQYEIVSDNAGFHSAVITIKYAVLGRFTVGTGYAPDAGSEVVDFKLRELDDGWKIEEQDPMTNPHVSRTSAVQWLQSALLTEKNATNKAAIESALKTLQGK